MYIPYVDIFVYIYIYIFIFLSTMLDCLCIYNIFIIIHELVDFHDRCMQFSQCFVSWCEFVPPNAGLGVQRNHLTS